MLGVRVPPGLPIWLGKRKMEKIEAVKTYLKEVRAELNKVTWTCRKEIVSGTIAVLILSAVVSIFLWVIDFGLSQVVRLVLS